MIRREAHAPRAWSIDCRAVRMPWQAGNTDRSDFLASTSCPCVTVPAIRASGRASLQLLQLQLAARTNPKRRWPAALPHGRGLNRSSSVFRSGRRGFNGTHYIRRFALGARAQPRGRRRSASSSAVHVRGLGCVRSGHLRTDRLHLCAGNNRPKSKDQFVELSQVLRRGFQMPMGHQKINHFVRLWLT